MWALLSSVVFGLGLEAAPARPQVQAQATVRIVQGVSLKLDGKPNPDAPPPRSTVIELERGTAKVAAKLIEFE